MYHVSSIMYYVSGKVIKGQGYGRKLGFPTANLDRRDYSRRKLKIRLGVYAGYVKIVSSSKYQVANIASPSSPPKIGGELKGWYESAIVIGPKDKSGLPKIEAHLLGFKGNLYGKKLEIILIKFIRPFRKFKSEEDLKRQIKRDIKRIRELKN